MHIFWITLALMIWFAGLVIAMFGPLMIGMAQSDGDGRNKGDAVFGLALGCGLALAYVLVTSKALTALL